LSAYRAERRFAKLFCNWVGFYPFRGPDASLTRQPSYQEPRSGATGTPIPHPTLLPLPRLGYDIIDLALVTW
jgi:hypothetical protein